MAAWPSYLPSRPLREALGPEVASQPRFAPAAGTRTEACPADGRVALLHLTRSRHCPRGPSTSPLSQAGPPPLETRDTPDPAVSACCAPRDWAQPIEQSWAPRGNHTVARLGKRGARPFSGGVAWCLFPHGFSSFPERVACRLENP